MRLFPLQNIWISGLVALKNQTFPDLSGSIWFVNSYLGGVDTEGRCRVKKFVVFFMNRITGLCLLLIC